jgi:hypothetical protein
MSSDTSPSGYIASASSVLTVFAAWRAFDNDLSTFYHSVLSYTNGNYTGFIPISTTPGSTTPTPTPILVSTNVNGLQVLGEWLQIKLPIGIILKGFIITPRQDTANSRSPRDFVMAGSNDGINWTQIASFVNQKFDTPAPVTFTLSNPLTTSFQYFRIIVKTIGLPATSYSMGLAIAQWSLLS